MADLLIDPVHSDTTDASSASQKEPWPILRMVMLSYAPPMELATAVYGCGRRAVAVVDSELPVAAMLGGQWVVTSPSLGAHFILSRQ